MLRHIPESGDTERSRPEPGSFQITTDQSNYLPACQIFYVIINPSVLIIGLGFAVKKVVIRNNILIAAIGDIFYTRRQCGTTSGDLYPGDLFCRKLHAKKRKGTGLVANRSFKHSKAFGTVKKFEVS